MMIKDRAKAQADMACIPICIIWGTELHLISVLSAEWVYVDKT